MTLASPARARELFPSFLESASSVEASSSAVKQRIQPWIDFRFAAASHQAQAWVEGDVNTCGLSAGSAGSNGEVQMPHQSTVVTKESKHCIFFGALTTCQTSSTDK